MTLRRGTDRTYSTDLKHPVHGRVHKALGTTQRRDAERLQVAVEHFLDSFPAGDPMVALFRRGKIQVAAVARCAADQVSFTTLRPTDPREVWPALGAAVDEYLAHLAAKARAGTGSAQTHLNTGTALRRALGYFGADTPIDAIDFEQVPVYRDYLLGQGDRFRAETQAAAEGRGAAPRAVIGNTAAAYLERLGALYRWHAERERKRARAKGRAPRPLAVPVEAEDVPDVRQTRVRFLAESEWTRVLAATPDRLKFPFAAAVYAGLRLTEVVVLRPMDVDEAGTLLYVQGRGAPGEPGYWVPKTGKNREVPMGDELRALYAWHRAHVASDRWLTPAAHDPAVPWQRQALADAFTAVVTRAGLVASRSDPQGVTFHTLRHTFASWAVMEGVDLLTIARLMGHATITQIQQTYGHLSQDHRREAVERLGARWRRLRDQGPAAPPAPSPTTDEGPAHAAD